jgi:hypothetical protein
MISLAYAFIPIIIQLDINIQLCMAQQHIGQLHCSIAPALQAMLNICDFSKTGQRNTQPQIQFQLNRMNILLLS